MILLLGQDCFDGTIEEVFDWVAALGGRPVRLNGEDMNGEGAFSLHLEGDGTPRLDVRLNGAPLDTAAVRAVWYRRWHTYRNVEFVRRAESAELAVEMRAYLTSELRAASAGVFDLLDGRPWLTRPGQTDVNKLATLRRAAAAGLAVPPTLVTNDRAELAAFVERHGGAITKSLWNSSTFHVGEERYSLYTEPVTSADVRAAPERFFPSLFQASVPKELEVRVFYLAGRCWPMAIFSQLDRRTAMDFRVYNRTRPNRYVPYRLSPETEDSLRALMRSIPLDTGSIDLIRTPAGEHVFLEVNPVGQFGMVSGPCNYHLEKKVAEHLIASASHD